MNKLGGINMDYYNKANRVIGNLVGGVIHSLLFIPWANVAWR